MNILETGEFVDTDGEVDNCAWLKINPPVCFILQYTTSELLINCYFYLSLRRAITTP